MSRPSKRILLARHTLGVYVNHFVTLLARTTFMVNTTVLMHPNPYVRAYPTLPWPPPRNGDDQEATRLLKDKLWRLEEIQDLAQQTIDGASDTLRAITKDCKNDMQSLQIDDEYAAQLLLLLVESDYRNSRWCHTGSNIPNRPELGWVPCDVYRLKVCDDDDARKIRAIVYYIKLCLNPLGKMVLLISLHESK